MRRGLRQFKFIAKGAFSVGWKVFPDEEGIETLFAGSVDTCPQSWKVFPDEEGIETKQPAIRTVMPGKIVLESIPR